MAADRSIACRAFAKINLELRVLGVRADGYHDAAHHLSVDRAGGRFDVHAVPGPFRILCDDPACPTDRRNLVWSAAELVWKAARRGGAPRGVTVTIAKRIPMQAGLGGGSSDGAAALRALARLWQVKLTRERLHRLAVGMGADVPYFLEGGTALGIDRGDRLSRLPDRARAWVVLVVPRFGVSTKEAFGWWDDNRLAPAERHGRGRRLERSAARRRPAPSRRLHAGGGARTGWREPGVAVGQRIGGVWPVQGRIGGPAGGRRAAPRKSQADRAGHADADTARIRPELAAK